MFDDQRRSVTVSAYRAWLAIAAMLLLAVVASSCLAVQGAFAAEQGEPASNLAAGAVKAADAATSKQVTADAAAIPPVNCRVKLAGKPWPAEWTGSGKTVGGKNAKIRFVQMTVPESGYAGSIKYRVKSYGGNWRAWTRNGASASAKGKNIAGVRIKLTGELARHYDVAYRVCNSAEGWLPWMINGATAECYDKGGISKMQVAIVKKGSVPAIANRSKTIGLARATKRAKNTGSSTGYLIMVDLTNHWLSVFKGGRKHWTLIKNWQVSNGAKGSPTVVGNFSVGDRGYSFGHGYTCYYWTQFYGDYLFHSVLYREGTRTVKDGRLGKFISAGCIRMGIENAKWIYSVIPSGTRVKTFK